MSCSYHSPVGVSIGERGLNSAPHGHEGTQLFFPSSITNSLCNQTQVHLPNTQQSQSRGLEVHSNEGVYSRGSLRKRQGDKPEISLPKKGENKIFIMLRVEITYILMKKGWETYVYSWEKMEHIHWANIHVTYMPCSLWGRALTSEQSKI